MELIRVKHIASGEEGFAAPIMGPTYMTMWATPGSPKFTPVRWEDLVCIAAIEEREWKEQEKKEDEAATGPPVDVEVHVVVPTPVEDGIILVEGWTPKRDPGNLYDGDGYYLVVDEDFHGPIASLEEARKLRGETEEDEPTAEEKGSEDPEDPEDKRDS